MFLEGWDQKETQESIDLADINKKLAGLNSSIQYQLMEHTNTVQSTLKSVKSETKKTTKQNEKMATELQKQAEEISQLHSIVKEQAKMLKGCYSLLEETRYVQG